MLYQIPDSEDVGQFKAVPQDHGLENILDWRLLNMAKGAISRGYRKESALPIKNVDRAVGTLLSNEITKLVPLIIPIP